MRAMNRRITDCFARLDGTPAFVAYMMAGDPGIAESAELLAALPGAGVDIIELGVPFTDPAADGPTIAESGLRSLEAGTTLDDVLGMVQKFRESDEATPVILMGYANPFHRRGFGKVAEMMANAGVDGAILVDIPPEEDSEVREAFGCHGLALIRLATPTTDAARLPTVVRGTDGFVYYVSMTGVTGSRDADASADLTSRVEAVRTASGLPVVVGFGIKTPEAAAEMAGVADGVVVGSAIVAEHHAKGREAALKLASDLAEAVHSKG